MSNFIESSLATEKKDSEASMDRCVDQPESAAVPVAPLRSIVPILIQDTREQRGYGELFESEYVVDTLSVGDYSVAGMTHPVSVERKSLQDLLQSLTRGRKRFEAELARGRALQRFYVVVESSAVDILQGRFEGKSQANPRAIWESICAFSIRYCPFLFSGNRWAGAQSTESLLLKFIRERYREIDRLEKASRAIREVN